MSLKIRIFEKIYKKVVYNLIKCAIIFDIFC